MSIIDAVAEFNTVFGTSTTDFRDVDLSKDKTVSNSMALITEEMNELINAIDSNDKLEYMDAIGDLMVVLIGLAVRTNLPIEDVFFEIKLCSSIEEAELIAIGKCAEPAYRPIAPGKFAVYDTITGKIQKSINYIPVDLTKFLPYMNSS